MTVTTPAATWVPCEWADLVDGDRVRIEHPANADGDVVHGTVDRERGVICSKVPWPFHGIDAFELNGFVVARAPRSLEAGYYTAVDEPLVRVDDDGRVFVSDGEAWHLGDRTDLRPAHRRLVPAAEVDALRGRIAAARRYVMSIEALGASHPARAVIVALLDGSPVVSPSDAEAVL